MPKPKGAVKTGGRKVGSVNKSKPAFDFNNLTKYTQENTGLNLKGIRELKKTIRETIDNVFDELQDDPKYNMKAWAKQELTEFYKLAAKMQSPSFNHQVNNTINIEWNETRTYHKPDELPDSAEDISHEEI